MTPATLQAQWPGETVAIFASGPSMTQEIADAVRGTCRVIAINYQALDLAPWADVIYGSDQRWWAECWDQVSTLPGRKLGLANAYYPQDVECLKRSTEAFDLRPDYLSGGGSSGYAAVNVAAKLGASVVHLYGYDMRKVAGRLRRREYPANLNSQSRFKDWIPAFEKLAPLLRQHGVRVINHTPLSALRCFEIADIAVEAKQA